MDIKASINRLTKHPLSGRAQDEAGVRKAVTPRYRYRIFYAVNDDTTAIQILSILHPARDG